MNNLLSNLPINLKEEVFEDLVKSDSVRIERIISKGHSSPEKGWYDQEENEWVVVLQGEGTLLFDDGDSVTLKAGDFINIPAHKKHKVSRTDPKNPTIWLAVFYR